MTSLFVNMFMVFCAGFLCFSQFTIASVIPADEAITTKSILLDVASDIHPDSELHTIAEDITTEEAKADPTAICAKDSELIDGTCKCNHSSCEKPPCEQFLNLATNATDNPGHCCSTYTCDSCIDKFLIDGKCVCPEEATVNEKGICECLDRHKSIVNNTCVCDELKCPLPDLCNINSIGIRQRVGCCTSIKCIDCPEDSYPKEYNSDLIEDICVCKECLDDPSCEDDFELVLTKHGENLPGSCCNEFKCVPRYCLFEGHQHKNEEKWLPDDNSECSCNAGIIECYPLSSGISDNNSCLVNNTVVPHHYSWMEEDGCTNCTCNNGEPTCTAHFCNVKHTEVPTQECPKVPCKRPCKHGYKYRNGCQICKCKMIDKDSVEYKETSTMESNQINKFKLLEEYMRSNNLTEGEIIANLQVFHRNLNVSSSTSHKPDKIMVDTTSCASDNSTSPFGNTSWVVLVVFGAIVLCIGFCLGWAIHYFYKKSASKKYHNNNTICPKSYSITSSDTKSSERKPLNNHVTR